MSDQPVRPTARYGTPQPASSRNLGGKAVAIILLVLLVALVVAIARYLAARDEVSVSAKMSNFERVDDSTLSLTIDVTRKDPSVPSYCIVHALDYDMSEVGRREVLIPAGGERAERITTEIPTRAVPVSGGVYGCSTTIPSYMDLPSTK